MLHVGSEFLGNAEKKSPLYLGRFHIEVIVHVLYVVGVEKIAAKKTDFPVLGSPPGETEIQSQIILYGDVIICGWNHTIIGVIKTLAEDEVILEADLRGKTVSYTHLRAHET